MAILTKEKLIDDIILQLTQSAPSDDLSLERLQVAHWASLHLNDLIRREIVEELRKGNMIPPIYVIRENALEIQEEDVADIDEEKQKMWIDLGNNVLDLPRDAGIVTVVDYDGNLIHKASLDGIEMLRDLRFAGSSSENPLYYREGKKVFLEGIITSELDFTPLSVRYVPKQDVIAMNDTDEILISDKLIPALVGLCVQLGKQELYGTQPDAASDGKDVKQIQYHTAISNVAQQQEQPQSEPEQ